MEQRPYPTEDYVHVHKGKKRIKRPGNWACLPVSVDHDPESSRSEALAHALFRLMRLRSEEEKVSRDT